MANFISARGMGGTTLSTPTLISVSPGFGVAAGGTSVVVTGTNFTSGVTVKFDGVPASSQLIVDGTTITCVTPAHAAGRVDVTLWAGATLLSTLVGGYAYTTIVSTFPAYDGGVTFTDNAYPSASPLAFSNQGFSFGYVGKAVGTGSVVRTRRLAWSRVPSVVGLSVISAEFKVLVDPTVILQETLEPIQGVRIFGSPKANPFAITPSDGNLSDYLMVSVPEASFSATPQIYTAQFADQFTGQAGLLLLMASYLEYAGQGAGAPPGLSRLSAAGPRFYQVQVQQIDWHLG